MRKPAVLVVALSGCVALSTLAFHLHTPYAQNTTMRFVVTELKGPFDNEGAAVSDINDQGQIVGVTEADDGAQRPFLWQRGTVTLLSLPGVMWGGAKAINNAGQVIGFTQAAAPPFLWRSGVTRNVTSLPTKNCQVSDLNALAQVVGEIFTAPATNTDEYAFVWQNGKLSTLNPLPGFRNSGANGINERGQITGTCYNGTNGGRHACLWQGRVARDLGTLGGETSAALAINGCGQVVGNADIKPGWLGDSSRHAFLWQHGRMRDLGTLGGSESQACDINDAGQVIGTSTTATGKVHPFLWDHGSIYDLNSLVERRAGWVLTDATAINNHGQIVGTGSKGMFLLTPINGKSH